MIKIFRQIRQRMIKENRVSKYLLYALGEIVLVVIGILIALQLNTLKEERIETVAVNDQLALMVTELEEDIVFYNKIMRNDSVQIVFLRALINGQYESLDLSNTPKIISKNFDAREFGTSYKVLKERGKLNALSSDSLRKAMVQYYETRSVSFNNMSSWHKDFVRENIESYLMSYLPLDSNALAVPSDIIQHMEDIKMRNIANFQLWNSKRFDRFALSSIEVAQDLIQLINTKLRESEYNLPDVES